MYIGIPKEVKVREGRVALIPDDVAKLVDAGHTVVVQSGAGEIAGFDDTDYIAVGALINNVSAAWACDMVVKVKEPIEQEYQYLREGLTVFSYLHLAANQQLIAELVRSKTRAIALENIEMDGRLPGLDPMSKVAGRIAGQLATYYLYFANGGNGILLGGIDGTAPGKAVIVGGGVAGLAAAHELNRLGTRVVVFDIDDQKIATINATGPQTGLVAKYSVPSCIRKELTDADILVGAVLVPGKSAPKVVTEDMIKGMPKGSVAIDIAIDQGGCIETMRMTNWETQSFVCHDVIHIGIPNMPGAVPRTSSVAVSGVIWPQALKIAAGIVDNVILKATSIEGGQIVDDRLK